MGNNFVVDLDQAVVNLLGITNKQEFIHKHGLTAYELNQLPRYFSIAMNILDEHLERLPQLHKRELLLESNNEK